MFSLRPNVCDARVNDQQLYGLASEAASHFRMGNDLLKSDPGAADEQYDMALRRYERMIDEGDVANQYVYYNIGNIYLMKKELGGAIINFRRAEKFDTHFPDLQKNLNYARSQRIDQISAQADKRILETLFFWHYDLKSQTKLLIATVAWFTLWVLGIIMLLRGKKPWLTGGLCLSLILLIGFSTSLFLTHLDTKIQEGVILADQVISRQGDGMNYAESFEQPLHAGTEFVLLEERSDWYHIQLLNGDQSWITANGAGLLQIIKFWRAPVSRLPTP